MSSFNLILLIMQLQINLAFSISKFEFVDSNEIKQFSLYARIKYLSFIWSQKIARIIRDKITKKKTFFLNSPFKSIQLKIPFYFAYELYFINILYTSILYGQNIHQ